MHTHTHFRSFANLNYRYSGVFEVYGVSNDLADFGVDIALIPFHDGRDFIAENQQASKLWKLP